MATPSEIGAARAEIIRFIQGYGCSTERAIRHLNWLYATGKLPEPLQRCFRQAWQKPRDFILSKSTYEKWLAMSKRRGNYEPLVKQKDHAVKPWHELAFHLKRRNPKSKTTEIHAKLLKKHPGVSIHQLLRYFRFIGKETEGEI